MLGQKRAHETPDSRTSPSKRSKSDSERWRSWETSDHAAAPAHTTGTASNYTYNPESDQTHTTSKEERRATPSRPTYFGFIYDALEANPNGLRSHEILGWLRENRPKAFQERGEEKFRVSIQTTLSAQSNKKKPMIWKYKDRKSNGSGYIWRLPNTEQSTEGLATPQSPHDASRRSPRHDGIVPSDEEVQAIAAYSPHGPQSESVPETSAASILIPLRTNVSSIRTPRADHDSGSSEPRVVPAQNTPHDGQSTIVDSALSTSEVEALVEEDSQRLVGVTSSASATDQQTLNTSVSTHIHESIAYRMTVAPHDAAIVAGPENRGQFQDDASVSGSRQQIYFGKLVMQMRSLRHKREQLKQEVERDRNTLPNIPDLKRNADQLHKRAQELSQQAEEARQESDLACWDLANAQDRVKRVDSAEGELQQIDQEWKEARSKLSID